MADRHVLNARGLPPAKRDDTPGPPPGGADRVYYGGHGNGLGRADTHLEDYLRTIYKRRWIAITTFAVVLLYATIHTFSTTAVYEGRVQLLVESVNPSVVTFKEVVQQDNYNYDFYPTQYAILKSRTLARRTIDTLKLWDSPEFGGTGGVSGKQSFSVMGMLSGAADWAAGLFASDRPEEASAPASGERR